MNMNFSVEIGRIEFRLQLIKAATFTDAEIALTPIVKDLRDLTGEVRDVAGELDRMAEDLEAVCLDEPPGAVEQKEYKERLGEALFTIQAVKFGF